MHENQVHQYWNDKTITYLEWNHTAILKICKIRGFHGGDDEEWRLLGCYAVWLL
jgi:hypothetical protein